MKRFKVWAWVIGILAWLVIGFLIARAPQPQIFVPGEKLWKAGPLTITNTLFTAWCSMLVIIVGSIVATRSMKLLPSGFQNFVEAGFGWTYDQVIQVAGERNGQRFFTLTATMFFFILIGNWLALLPFFNAIGITEDVGHEIFQQIAEKNPSELSLKNGSYTDSHQFAGVRISGGSGFYFIPPGTGSATFTVNNGDTPQEAADRYYVFLAEQYTTFNLPKGQTIDNPSAATVRSAVAALNGDSHAPHVVATSESSSTEGIASPALKETVTGIDFSNAKRLVTVVPLFRSAFSDVSNVLALTLISFFMVEFYGFKAYKFGYLKKFFNFSSPLNFFIGLLELVSELARIISLTFRLFGNIFGGEVLSQMVTFLIPFLVVEFAYVLEIFEGFIQAGIFAVLTLLFAVLAVQEHEGEEHHEQPERAAPATESPQVPSGAAQAR